MQQQEKGENKWGTKDIETAIFFDDDRRYADLLNGYIFDGKQVIMEKQLYSQDTRETGKSQKDSWGVQKRKKIQRFRDGVKRVAFGTSFYDHCPGTPG